MIFEFSSEVKKKNLSLENFTLSGCRNTIATPKALPYNNQSRLLKYLISKCAFTAEKY